MAKRESGTRSTGLSRRDFGRRAALTLAGGTLASAGMLGSAEAGAIGKDPAHSSAASPRVEAPGLSPGARAEIEAKLQRIFSRYGDRLSDTDRKKLHGVVTDHVRMLERIRAVPVHNSDPPAPVLELMAGGDAGPKG